MFEFERPEQPDSGDMRFADVAVYNLAANGLRALEHGFQQRTSQTAAAGIGATKKPVRLAVAAWAS